jgi:penicillin G amidase
MKPLSVTPDLPRGGDEQTVNKAGFEGDVPFDVCIIPSWRVVYDLADLDNSRGILPAGQSGNPASPHWNDQSNAWATGELRPLPFTRPAVEAAATERLTIVPG